MSDCEGAGEMFRVTSFDLADVPKNEDGSVDYTQDFFGKAANLTVSGQLNAECFAQAFSKVYTFGPTFRAERSNTQRHAAEFWMIEPEIAFSDLADDMALAENMTRYVVKYVMDNCPADLEFFNKFVDNTLLDRLNNIVNSSFAHVTYTEAIKLLEESGKEFEYKPFWGCDMQTEHERYLCEQIFRKPVFVTDYPKEIKAFYMRQNDDGKTVAAMDMLVPGVGELIGGSSVRSAWISFSRHTGASDSIPRITGGIRSFANTAARIMRASVSASSVSLCISRAFPTSAMLKLPENDRQRRILIFHFSY